MTCHAGRLDIAAMVTMLPADYLESFGDAEMLAAFAVAIVFVVLCALDR